MGSEKIPAPIYLKLTPIAEVLSKSAWGQTWDEYGIDARQENLKQALNMYPVHVGAHIDKGMALILAQVFIISGLPTGTMVYNFSCLYNICRSSNKCLSQVNMAKWNICLTSTSVWMPSGI